MTMRDPYVSIRAEECRRDRSLPLCLCTHRYGDTTPARAKPPQGVCHIYVFWCQSYLQYNTFPGWQGVNRNPTRSSKKCVKRV